MTNAFYNPTGTPGTAAFGSSASIRSEFLLVAAGFDLLPTSLPANALVVVNGSGTALTTSTTPNIGTPSAGVLTNCTGLPISTGVSGLGTGVATALGIAIGNAGAFVAFNGALGTPSSGTLTNCTGYPAGNLSGLGAGVATFIATPSSANLAAALTDKTGTGVNVFATSPTLVTPVLGVASATSINKVAITAPASGSTLTIADGKTLTASNSIALSGTDGTSLNINAVTTVNSGTYTPVGAGLTNVTSVTPGKAQWLRVGNIVTVSGTFSCTPTAATATSFTLTLPVASALAATTDLAGAGGNDNDNVVLFVVGKTSNGTAQVSYFATTTNPRVFSYTYTYEVK